MRTDIVVIGGYGHVGAQICTLLSGRFPGAVYAAGRSLERAEQFCRSTGGRVKPLQMDAAEAFSADKMRQVKLVVMCLDQQDSSFAEACLIEGIHYIDVTANLAFFGQMAQLAGSGNKYGATALLSVGLAPGLTNLLAGEAKLSMDKVQQLDIAVLLGLGDSHGQAAIEWTVDNLAAQFEVMQNGKAIRADSFTDAKITDWGVSLGKRRAYRFPFSDQQVLPQTLGIPTVSTRLCFDSRAATSGIAVLQKLGLLKWLGHRRFRKMAVRSFGTIRLGTERYAIKVEASGLKNGAAATSEYVIQGFRESTITAQVAAIAAGTLYSNGYVTPGIYHLEQLLRVRLSEDRISLYLPGQEDAGMDEEIRGLQCWARHSYTN